MEGTKQGTRIGPDVVPVSFSEFIHKAQRGTVEARLGEKLRDVVKGIRDTKKPGSVTLTIGMEPVKGDVNTLAVNFTIKAKVPEATPDSSVYFSADDGALTRDNPRQRDMFEGADEGGAR
jgi:hypothetical protein